MGITVRRLPSGHWHVRGEGPCNWTQPTRWPATEAELREHAFTQASDAFLRAAADLAARSCGRCGHVHGGRDLAGICIGCPCPEREQSPGPRDP